MGPLDLNVRIAVKTLSLQGGKMNFMNFRDWLAPKVFELPEDDGRRYFIADELRIPAEIPSHKRSHVDRKHQSLEAKRAMIQRATKR